jgi:hypothetical protein
MIISNLLGGLGNQMFQYAAGRALSLERGQPLHLDISRFADYRLHQGFELQRVFYCPVDVANAAEVRRILGWQGAPLIRRVLARPALAAFRREGFVVEPHFHYWPGIRDVPQDCYLLGYWQSEKYFRNVTAEIRVDFTFNAELASRNAELAEQISQVNAVSLHVRRGDYAQDPKTNDTHGLCSLEYYRAAIQYVADRLEQPYFFIFSDDMAWVKTNLKIDFQRRYIDHNRGAESYNDMRLMSLCQHHIIANSSFSWWAAWLNPCATKMVVAPKRWFANAKNIDDLIPETWVSL